MALQFGNLSKIIIEVIFLTIVQLPKWEIPLLSFKFS
jgi:hypothetical protein